MTGTAAHVSPIIKIDHRPIGNGTIGPISKKIQHMYFEATKGNVERYARWCTPVNAAHPAGRAAQAAGALRR